MCRNPIQCIVPPYMIEQLARSPDPVVRESAIAHLQSAAATRATRAMSRSVAELLAARAPDGGKNRLVYDARGLDRLPGTLVRSEGQATTKDSAINEAYDNAGSTYDFYESLFMRNSLDGNGMRLVSSVHVGEANGAALDNAFWNGQQMAYGDGDGRVFSRFTKALDVVAHELTHGVQQYTSNLTYQGESGALNEHFSDVFGILVRQWKNGESVGKASWLIGADVLVPAPTRRAIRDMEHPGTAYRNDPDLGSDPQPASYAKRYTGAQDNGGVHLNSGIPNRAFVLTAKAIGGKAWETAGRIWYDTMLQLSTASRFADCARVSAQVAAGQGAAAAKAVKAAWKKVGVSA